MKNTVFKKIKVSNPYKFLLGVLAVYAVLLIVNSGFVLSALKNTLHLTLNIFPVLILVFIVMLLVNLYVKGDKLKKYLGEESGIRGWIYAVIAGILIAGPPYILYPILSDLKRSGAKDSLLAVHLFNRNVKIPFVPVMVYYFGLGFTVIISAYIIIFSIFNGILVGHFSKSKK